MSEAQHRFAFAPEIIVDLFAGGGGASLGIEQAFGRPVDVAVNHDAIAIGVHTANHPQTRHYTADVFEVDPIEATGGQPVGLLWASPDCKHFSKAKGGKPRSKKIRSLAWVVVKWAKTVRPVLKRHSAPWSPAVKSTVWSAPFWRSITPASSGPICATLSGQ
jgi:site-specific DNA-cytosine methylase